jgi:hypothetical protein
LPQFGWQLLACRLAESDAAGLVQFGPERELQ